MVYLFVNDLTVIFLVYLIGIVVAVCARIAALYNRDVNIEEKASNCFLLFMNVVFTR